MKILGIGTDIASIERFSNSRVHMDTFANKILTDFELEEYKKIKDYQSKYLAKKWAAKESISKAFGTGISKDTKWKNIEIRHSKNGQPIACFYNELKESLEVLGARCHLSISDEGDSVVAFSIIEYRD